MRFVFRFLAAGTGGVSGDLLSQINGVSDQCGWMSQVVGCRLFEIR